MYIPHKTAQSKAILRIFPRTMITNSEESKKENMEDYNNEENA